MTESDYNFTCHLIIITIIIILLLCLSDIQDHSARVKRIKINKDDKKCKDKTTVIQMYISKINYKNNKSIIVSIGLRTTLRIMMGAEQLKEEGGERVR